MPCVTNPVKYLLLKAAYPGDCYIQSDNFSIISISVYQFFYFFFYLKCVNSLFFSKIIKSYRFHQIHIDVIVKLTR